MTKIDLTACQSDVYKSQARFRILVAGRRFGKTYLALVELFKAACEKGRLAWYVAPTYRQAKRIAWKPLKEMTRRYWACQPNETDLRIELRGGGTICLKGADNYESLRGDGLDFLILDEYASIAKEVWPEVLRPALADRNGKGLFIGTPHGHNHFYELFNFAKRQQDWAAFQFTTAEGGNVSKEELEGATHELDQRTYRQEFEASFENVSAGRVYHAFSREGNVDEVFYDSRLPLFWSLDFNINPMCAVIGQVDGKTVYVLEEIVLRDSNTPKACEVFAQRLGKLRRAAPFGLPIGIYGDATASTLRTNASRTDWQIVKAYTENLGHNFEFRRRSSNPPVKDRVNCVNAMLCNQASERRLIVDPKCKHLIEDFERVLWKSDPSGNFQSEIDKSDPDRSHVSDALGYMIAHDFGMSGRSGEMPGLMQ